MVKFDATNSAQKITQIVKDFLEMCREKEVQNVVSHLQRI
jgi:hypothetical protein